MEAYVQEIAIAASGLVLDPLFLGVLTIAAFALVTGLAGRLCMFVEDRWQERRNPPTHSGVTRRDEKPGYAGQPIVPTRTTRGDRRVR